MARSREVAWRVFADEYNSSSVELRDEGEYAPAYVLTPLGALVNRVFAVGVLLPEVENMGTEEEPLYRARLQDPTGVFYLSAGQYQPEAAKALGSITPPAFVAVVAKTRTYSPEDGLVYVSLRPEVIKEVGAEERDLWVLEAARSSLARIEACRDVRGMEEPSEEGLASMGHQPKLARGVLKALEAYGEVDLNRYNRVVTDALRTLLGEGGDVLEAMASATAPPEAPGPVTSEPPTPPPAPEAPAQAPASPQGETAPTEGSPVAPGGPPQTEEEMDNLVLSLVRELDTGARGAAYDAILDHARERGMDRDSFEETINRLLDQGLIYEPILGQIKLI